MNGLGQGSYAAALSSSINIGSAVYDITKEEYISNIGTMPLNCLIFQDDIAKMIQNEEDARKGAWEIRRMLDSKTAPGKFLKVKVCHYGQQKIKICMLESCKSESTTGRRAKSVKVLLGEVPGGPDH